VKNYENWSTFAKVNDKIKVAYFLRATRSIERYSYGNVAGWVAGWLSVTAGIVSKRLNLS